MRDKIIRVVIAVALFACIFGALVAVSTLLRSTSGSYQELTEEIEQRDIDTGNALNYSGDDTSFDAVREAEQTLAHPPGVKQ